MPDVDLKLVMAEGDYLRRVGDELVGAVPAGGGGGGDVSRVPVSEFGITGDGSNEATKLQTAFNSGEALIVPKGVKVTVGAQLLVPSGLDLVIDGRIERTWDGAGTGGAMFYANPASNVRITGNGSVGAVSLAAGGGSIFNGTFNDTVFSGITVDTYWGGQAFVFAGDRVRMERVRVINSGIAAGTGGIRYYGGDDFVAYGCHVESGDDALQFVPPEGVVSASCRRGAYIGCTGYSTAGRFMAVILGGVDGINTAGVEDCSFIGCHGKGSLRGIIVMVREMAPGSIRRVSFRDCSIDMTHDATTASNPGAISILNEQAVGTTAAVVEDILLDNVTVMNPAFRSVDMKRVNRATITNCVFEASRTDPASELKFWGCRDLVFTRNTVKTFGTFSSVSLADAEPGLSCDRPLVEGNQILAVRDGAFGVTVDSGVGAVVRRNRFTAAAAAPLAAVRVPATTTLFRIERNNFTGYPITPVSVANGTQGHVFDNAGIAPVVTVTSPTTITALDDRRVIELNSTGARIINLLLDSKASLPVGEWFDAININTGTWTLTPEAGVTLRGTATIAAGQAAQVIKTAANTYTVTQGPTGPAGAAGATGPTGPAGPVETTQTIEAVSATTYTVVAADAGKLKRLTGASCTVTLDAAGVSTGQRVDFACIGGVATFVLSGATWDVAPTPSAVARAVGSFVTAIKTGATTWCLVGDLA